MFNDSHFRGGGTNLGCFPVGGWLTIPTSPPVYGPAVWVVEVGVYSVSVQWVGVREMYGHNSTT